MKSLPIRLIYFGFNYPHGFIAEVWKDEPNIVTHLQAKFAELYDIHGYKLVFFSFFVQLSTDNQQKLIDWIDTNYKGLIFYHSQNLIQYNYEHKYSYGKPFVSWVDRNAKPTLEANEFLKLAFVRFYTNNEILISHGIYKSMGYVYDFKPYLKKYLYKQYGEWHEAFAPNKTTLRKVKFGKIDKIIELND